MLFEVLAGSGGPRHHVVIFRVTVSEVRRSGCQLRHMPYVAVLLRGSCGVELLLDSRARGDFLGDAFFEMRLALRSGPQFGLQSLLLISVRGFRVVECLFERATGRPGFGQQRAKFCFAPGEVVSRSGSLRGPILLRLFERGRGDAHLRVEVLAGGVGLCHHVVILGVTLGELRYMPCLRVLLRGSYCGELVLEGLARVAFLGDALLEVRLALSRSGAFSREVQQVLLVHGFRVGQSFFEDLLDGSRLRERRGEFRFAPHVVRGIGGGLRRPRLPGAFERGAGGVQLLLESLAGGCGLLHLRLKPMLRVLPRGFGARQGPLGVGARVDFEREALLEIRMARASGGQLLLESLAGG